MMPAAGGREALWGAGCGCAVGAVGLPGTGVRAAVGGRGVSQPYLGLRGRSLASPAT
jgi:hypothetical protein